MALGATITGTGALAVELASNPIESLPVQTQINKIIEGLDRFSMDVLEGFNNVEAVLKDVDRRLTVLEQKK